LSLAAVLVRKKLHPQIKWPNDLQLNGEKMAGILVETSSKQNEIEVILGLGINVNMPHDLLKQIDQPATSLLHETGHIWDRKELLKELQNQFAQDLGKFKRAGFKPFQEQFNQWLAYKNEKITVHDGEKDWTGICDSISENGELVIHLRNNEVKKFSSGSMSCAKT